MSDATDVRDELESLHSQLPQEVGNVVIIYNRSTLKYIDK
jgi:hypothetical protein